MTCAMRLASVMLALCACSDDSLVQRICEPGTVSCLEHGAVEVCSPQGTAWLASACPEGERCAATSCGVDIEDACRPLSCQPGERRCAPADPANNLLPNLRIETCDETQTGWCCLGSCVNAHSDGVCFRGQCVSVCAVGQKSYIGCEYFAADLDNAFLPNSTCGIDPETNARLPCDAAGKQFAIVVSNPDLEGLQQEAAYMVSTGPSASETVAEQCGPSPTVVAADVLPPNGIAIVPLPRRDIDGTVKDLRAYRVGASLPITVYQFNPLQNEQVFSNDASLLLPTNTAGDRYYVMTREQTFDLLKGYFTVIGITDEPTLVTVRVTARTLAGPGIPELYPDDEYSTVLGRYEVLNIETNEVGADLTGSLITASGPVVVYGGSEAANAPNTSRCVMGKCWDGVTSCNTHADCTSFITCCADHLEEQLFPVSTWGNEYVGVRSMPRGNELDIWRVMAGADNTQVVVQPPLVQVPLLNEGQWFEFETGQDFVLLADKPVLLAQFLAAEQAPDPNPPLVNHVEGDAGTGDPAMMLAVPTRQLLAKYVFLAPADLSANKFYEKHYVSIAAPQGASVRLGVQEVGQLDPLVDELQVADIPGTTWRAYRVRIAPGFHTLTCPETCSVMVHGYDQYVSYGYPGGLGLEDAL